MKTSFSFRCLVLLFFLVSTLSASETKAQQTVQSKSVTAPVFLLPLNYSGCDSLVNFVWYGSGDHVTYELWVADTEGFGSSQQFVTTDTNFSCAIKAKINQAVYCKVRAWKNATSYSEWSAVLVVYYRAPLEQIHPDLNTLRGGGCHGNCSNCRNPCGRRPSPTGY
jgi:hypothetical protein